MARVEVDPRRCCGYRICVEIAPEIFAMNALGKSESLIDVLTPGLEKAAREAARECPAGAIMVHESEPAITVDP